ncbi:low affinity iron permease family protein [Solimonas soli]|uniref:low affinity iron permease family protein n=1 Tax=Solimonas soli TaxID=413479 RepID=UPI00048166C9|nr:low affinity iron permease family protein [Solimonas soli]
MKKRSKFSRFAQKTATLAGRPAIFAGATLTVLLWATLGPLFGYSDTWQLVINTGTTIVTFLMVFLIQNTQNRDAEAVHIKLDEILRATADSNKALLNLEELDEEELDAIRQQYLDLAEGARTESRQGRRTTGGAERRRRAKH